MKKREKTLREIAEEFGLDLEMTKKNHFRLIWNGKTVAVASGSPSDPRSEKNLRADIRRRIKELSRD